MAAAMATGEAGFKCRKATVCLLWEKDPVVGGRFILRDHWLESGVDGDPIYVNGVLRRSNFQLLLTTVLHGNMAIVDGRQKTASLRR